MIYITGDTHGKFARIEYFCKKIGTSKDDILIILGDAGINFHQGERDVRLKKSLLELPITLFCIHGNHEMRPSSTDLYQAVDWKGGTVYREEQFPNILFAIDGELYDFNDKRCIVIGGAYSVDKFHRMRHGYGWWSDEQPSEEIKAKVEQRLEQLDYKIDVVLTHTTPEKYEPTEMFLSSILQSTVDKSTERWLDAIEDRLIYSKWYCGHYHTDKVVDRIEFMYEGIKEFAQDVGGIQNE